MLDRKDGGITHSKLANWNDYQMKTLGSQDNNLKNLVYISTTQNYKYTGFNSSQEQPQKLGFMIDKFIKECIENAVLAKLEHN